MAYPVTNQSPWGADLKDYIDTADIGAVNAAKAYADGGDAATLSTANTVALAGDASTLSTAQTYTDDALTGVLADAADAAAAADVTVLNDAKTYADDADAVTLTAAEAYADAADAGSLDAALDRANHFGTQLASTISDLDAAVALTVPDTATSTGLALATTFPVVVMHDTDPDIARPADATFVIWVGTVEPVHKLATDLWHNAP